LTEAGIALVRASIANDLLDPTYDARGVRWLRGQGGIEEAFVRQVGDVVSEDWIRSPFFHLLESGRPMLRWRLNARHRRGEIPLLDQFQGEGATDYVAFSSRVAEGVLLGGGRGIVASWSSNAPDGFTDAQIDLLAAVMPSLTLAIRCGPLLKRTHADRDIPRQGCRRTRACGQHRARPSGTDPCRRQVQRPEPIHSHLG
jgi:adenylate cyclase